MFKRLIVGFRSKVNKYLQRSLIVDELLIFIFSKDRPLQLDLLLKTLGQNVKGKLNVQVLFNASNVNYENAYKQVFEENDSLNLLAIQETKFRPDMIEILKKSNCKSIMFLVDDIAFIRPVDADLLVSLSSQGYIVSTRLGKNITHSQTQSNILVTQPYFKSMIFNDETFLSWYWYKSKSSHWSLPTALDGNVFQLSSLIPIIESVSFKAPNSLEEALGVYRFVFKFSKAVCYEQPRIVNFPLNSVKTEEFNFPHMGLDTAEMLSIYEDGGRLDISDFSHDIHNSPHMEWVPKIRNKN
ncbi:hypothetical protein Q4567_19280 [Aliiglaciecola sp. 2_MG-2023]|uniref:hypothetical protein n=1 Tax=unclassified Aliiglaciecola TaxID=2593648 RepID=UPI0026E39B66|nr:MULTISPECIES: hypothetical protein [unclassified Aliiglaciecola]MDO6712885.1 hypothetical protein [Aliiglaciecola sp. 2_MG-2023]MDO6752879.1 hypothetical protein [Aliiglaciecola sp. 1_MG-2023]